MRSMQIENFLNRFSLAQRFLVASTVIMIAGVTGIGFWIGKQIETGVVNRIGATSALYVDSVISSQLQELAQKESLLPEHIQTLDQLMQNTPLGQQLVVFKVWDKTGRIIYSTTPFTIGQAFPIEERLRLALAGEVISRISSLDDDENVSERKIWPKLLEIYMPVRLSGTHQIIAAAEFYLIVDELEKEVTAAQTRSWLVVGAVMLVMYVLLAVFVKWTSDTIARQQNALNAQVVQLTDLLRQNDELHERVRRAAASVATHNERSLRRISAELHDGPAQDMSLAALGLGDVIKQNSMVCPLAVSNECPCGKPLTSIHTSLQRALKDMRAIAAGLGLPQLQELNLAETVIRAVRSHERRSGTKVLLTMDGRLEQGALPLKITVYRFIQEALNNAYRHAGGAGQQVQVNAGTDHLYVEVLDQGPGFNVGQVAQQDERLGLAGMRERVESLEGIFHLESEVGRGTKVTARFSLRTIEGDINEQ